MEPTVPANSIVLVSTLDYRFGTPKVGDVIAFWHERVEPETFIKRVLATPGQSVKEDAGVFRVDGRIVAEGALRIFDPTHDKGGNGCCRSLTSWSEDNRPQSDDSRNWGDVAASSVMGACERRHLAVVGYTCDSMSDQEPHIQWFPGHMAASLRRMEETPQCRRCRCGNRRCSASQIER